MSATPSEAAHARWLYRIVNIGPFGSPGRLGMSLALFGSQGWELVTVYEKASNWFQGLEKGFMLFKRRAAAGGTPDGPWAEVWTSDQIEVAYNSANQG